MPASLVDAPVSYADQEVNRDCIGLKHDTCMGDNFE